VYNDTQSRALRAIAMFSNLSRFSRVRYYLFSLSRIYNTDIYVAPMIFQIMRVHQILPANALTFIKDSEIISARALASYYCVCASERRTFYGSWKQFRETQSKSQATQVEKQMMTNRTPEHRRYVLEKAEDLLGIAK